MRCGPGILVADPLLAQAFRFEVDVGLNLCAEVALAPLASKHAYVSSRPRPPRVDS
jgi:hypothetical protein